MQKSTFFQAQRRYEAWSWYEYISPDEYCAWSTPLAVNEKETNSFKYVDMIIL